MRASAAACFAVALAIPALAHADSIGGPCPSGQMWRSNPTQPGAIHHAGGQCVPDPSASHGCAVSRSAHGETPGLAFVLLGTAVVLRRRDKVHAR